MISNYYNRFLNVFKIIFISFVIFCQGKVHLLFYTNGDLVYNRENELMPNGTDLEGHKSSSQSVIAVPKPGADSVYFLFTVDAVASNLNNHKGLNYSILDMR